MLITKELLDHIYDEKFNVETFKSVDPCGIVHKLAEHTSCQMDIEIGGLFTAMIAWGSRKVIRPTAERMLSIEMGWHPADFIKSEKYETAYENAKNGCVYRTLNVDTFRKVCRRLNKELNGYDNIEERFHGMQTKEVIATICEWLSEARVGTMDKSACKRICMFVRWMTRTSSPDFCIWKTRDQADLYAIMDVHVSRLTQDLLKNKRPTWKACEELTDIFKSWSPCDPLKYDLALMTLADNMEYASTIQKL